MTSRPLRVFLCHSSNDKPAVRELYQKLRAEPWIDPWLDEEKLFPGMDWNLEIEKAIGGTDVILVCLSNKSITKEGYVQKEIKTALDFSDYKPEGAVFIIPVRLEECQPPTRLSKWQYEDYFSDKRERAFDRLLVSLQTRATSLGLKLSKAAPFNLSEEWVEKNKIKFSNGMEFMRVPKGKFLMGSTNENEFAYDFERPQHVVDIPYDYWMARYLVTNELYDAYVKSTGKHHPVWKWESKKDHPVTYVFWKDALAYCQWISSQFHSELPAGLILRLPTEAEWEKAARWKSSSIEREDNMGEALEYPWGNTFDKYKCNTREGGRNTTTPVGFYSPKGDSPYGCSDMAGNVLEWINSLNKPYPYNINDGREMERNSPDGVLRGGCFCNGDIEARCAYRGAHFFFDLTGNIGFRVCLAPPLPK